MEMIDPGNPTEVREQRRKTASFATVWCSGILPSSHSEHPRTRKRLFGWANVCRLNTEGQAGTDARDVEKSGWSDLPQGPGYTAKQGIL